MTITNKINIYALDFKALETWCRPWGQSKARAREIWDYIYKHWVADFNKMDTLPPALLTRLDTEMEIYTPRVLARQEAPDGATRKDLLELQDGERIEVVMLRYRDRRSACISTQVGCACGCVFCATGQSGFVRQLTSGEIITQIVHLQRELAPYSEELSNIVIMGMGEPLLNVPETIAAVRRLLHPYGLAFAPRRITLSTVGIVPGILKLAQENLRINLAISLHAATDEVRNQLMPINKHYPLDDLFKAIREYTTHMGRHILLEWVMIDGVNDTEEQARALVTRLAGLPAHVNLIQLNPTEGYAGRPSPPQAVDAFTAILDQAGIPHTMRQRRGGTIEAGCGQLRRQSQDSEP
ncbi:MAG: 23S rRNA (adenine(2503)-C(2))-methyltransferase RlmN [Anaerolineae bacterium]|nr:23S rRNA (adenine(2503)-C(2))-methyltransferase RlmN [Anaerolineae bacterium]